MAASSRNENGSATGRGRRCDGEAPPKRRPSYTEAFRLRMPLAVIEPRQTFPEDQRSRLTLTQREASCAARSAWSSPGRPAGMGLRAVGSSAWAIARVAAATVRESRAGGRRSRAIDWKLEATVYESWDVD